MDMIWLMGGFFVFVTLAFIAFAILLPEWVGITGKKAREAMKEHQGDAPVEEPKK